MITKEQLEHWRKLSNATTEGPWGTESPDWGKGATRLHDFSGYTHEDIIWIERGYYDEVELNIKEVDRTFIIMAREAVPALLDEVERLRKLLARKI